jgi:hypothetical protein
MTKRRVELMVKTERWVLKGAKPQVIWCFQCGASSMMLSVEQAVMITRADQSIIRLLIKTGRLHSVETADPRSRVCLASLSNVFKDP